MKLSRIGLGSYYSFGEKVNQLDADSIVKVALESGINHFDSAEIYGFGKAEEILGSALRNVARRPEYVISSKVFFLDDL